MAMAFISSAAPFARGRLALRQASISNISVNMGKTSFISPRFVQQARLQRTACPTAVRVSTFRMAMGSTKGDDKVLEGPIEGLYGEWYLKQSDADGVFTYRAALAAMSLCMSATVALALTGGTEVPSLGYDALYFLNLISFGVALQTIHIYAKPLHNVLKILWGLALAGSVVLSVSPLLSGNGLVVETYAHPALLLAVGWQYVALTGLFVKEAFCFGRLEAISLIFLVPFLAGGHFIGLLPSSVESYGAAAFAALFLFFSARKFTQPARDDIGDMTVFEHLAKGGSV